MRGRHQRPRRPPTGPQVALPGRLYGIRAWSLSADRVGAVRLGCDEKRWRKDGESTWARCVMPDSHPPGAAVPAGSCGCGLYALHPWKSGRVAELAYGLGVVGIVEAWGRVQLHAEGFRAQYARPVAISLAGVPRRSDVGRVLEDVAITHRAALLELESHEALLRHCDVEGIGMPRRAVETLLSCGDPGRVRVDGQRPASAGP